ncbi:MAG: UTP--glucose-1-phosphate uridylyltransferase [Planctomycetota bacterium]
MQSPDLETIRARLSAAGQEHLLQFWPELSEPARAAFAAQLAALDLDLVRRLFATRDQPSDVLPPAEALEHPPVIEFSRQHRGDGEFDAAWAQGEAALRADRVVAFVVAGGQGTRLGFDHPKGCFPIGPVSERSLFQLHAEKILALRRRYRCRLPWLIMTSPENHAETKAFFGAHEYFGLSADSVWFFSQGMMPAVGLDGKILLRDKSELALSPNGHGGSIAALHTHGIFDRLREGGHDLLYYFQVDNPMLRIAEPAFLGYHLAADVPMSLKVIRKREAAEKVGVSMLVAGQPVMVEYSDLDRYPPEANIGGRRNADGGIHFWAGSIAIHLFNRDFLEAIARELKLPWHIARKAVAHLDATGTLVKPPKPNAIKFEMFIFDTMPLAGRALNVETDRPGEFSPLKNKDGVDSPATARADLTDLYAGWLSAAGHRLPTDAAGRSAQPIEIAPATSLFGEGLENTQLPPPNRPILL